jgi:hypothetical protein
MASWALRIAGVVSICVVLEILVRWLKGGYFSGVIWGLGLLTAALVVPRMILATPWIRNYLWPEDVALFERLKVEQRAKRAKLAMLEERERTLQARAKTTGSTKKRNKRYV